MIRDMGGEAVLHPLIPDDQNALEQAVNTLLPQVDILILNAGTSKGDEDYCGQLLERSGGLFHGVAAVPGRPMSGAVMAGKPVLNLSGPALAAFYSLDWMVRALVCRYLGIPVPKRQRVRAALTAPLRCPPPMSMLCMMEVCQQLDGSFTATPLARRGPNAAGAGRQLMANGLYVTTPGEPDHQPGEIIEAELLSCQA
jgi:molybdopterin molybdotransferase/putative molybdopterin biosynthesis protein